MIAALSPLRIIKRFTRDTGGIAALEFAFMAPVLLLVLMGVIELTNALSAKRKLLASVQSTADLIGQQTNVTASDLDLYLLGGQLAFAPYDSGKLKLAVVSVRYDDISGDPYVDWTDSYNGGTVGDPLIKAQDHGDPGDSIIIVTGTYTYSPIASIVMAADVTMTEIAYVRPRTSSYVLLY